MLSNGTARSHRKPPGERRAEIAAAAADIALEHGLERITLRAVAERLAVRPGLIHHYFGAVDDLVAAAFALAAAEERGRLLATDGAPMGRLIHLVTEIGGASAERGARLWLNARHLSRFNPALADALEEQETLYRARLRRLVGQGVDDGVFRPDDPDAACIRILVAIDGFGAYANGRPGFAAAAFTGFVGDVAEWSLGLAPGTLAGQRRS
ncbi:MAG: TetR family transcriptional regulator C-terminal domain-containing protein [Gordonia sp. (in: high G+C Gram-positive bacteria)]